jgi:AmmeMemoRadiSam system protein B
MMKELLRKPVVAGSFYPGNEKELSETVRELLSAETVSKERAKGVVVPHAGYIYSGKVAGLTYGSIEVPDNVIIIGPNHTGLGEAVSVMSNGAWEIPGGSFEINNELADSILSLSNFAIQDAKAHLHEHSIEVQLPFIKAINPNVKFVPIVIGTHRIDVIEDVGEAIAHVIEKYSEPVLVIASSDMSHYVKLEEAERLDSMAIRKIEALDFKGLMDIVEQEDISMCGAAPVAIMLKACKILEATKSKLIHYNTSAEASGETGQVVGYAGVRVI